MTASDYPYFEGDHPLVLPHRGGMEVVPENTLEALEYSDRNKFTHFETDLRMSKDGVVFLHHDETLDRTTRSEGKVSEYLWHDLLKINAGEKFYERKNINGKKTTFISLEDALAKFSNIKLNLDLKQSGMEKKVLEIIMDSNASERTLVSSFSPRRLRKFQEINQYNIAISASIKENLQSMFNSRLFHLWNLRVQALQIPIRWNGIRVLTNNLVEYAHSKNIKVHVWTINNLNILEDCLELGCDGIMTDRPVEVREFIMEKYGKR